jgi:cytochrome c556
MFRALIPGSWQLLSNGRRRFRLVESGANMQKFLGLFLVGTVLVSTAVAAKRQPPVAVPKPAPVIAPAAAKPSAIQEGLIFERQQIMKELDEQAETLGNIVAGLEPRSKLAETTRGIAKRAKESMESFRNPLPGGRSKPEVWSNHTDYMQRMATFVRETEELAKLGEAGNLSAVTEKLVTALPCKSCHDVYRARKQP